MRDYLDKAWLLDCCKDRTITIRRQGEEPFDKALPVYSVDTKEEAEGLRVFTCSLVPGQHPLLPEGEPWYKMITLALPWEKEPRLEDLIGSTEPLELEDLERVTAKLVWAEGWRRRVREGREAHGSRVG